VYGALYAVFRSLYLTLPVMGGRLPRMHPLTWLSMMEVPTQLTLSEASSSLWPELHDVVGHDRPASAKGWDDVSLDHRCQSARFRVPNAPLLKDCNPWSMAG
jgi:hypothetical protein